MSPSIRPTCRFTADGLSATSASFALRGLLETPIYSVERKDLIRTFREFEVPADAVAGDGYLALAFLNVPLNDTVVIFPLEDGIELLYKADTFTANFVRAVLLVFVRLVFLAALAVFAGSFLSFPVAILLCLAVFTMANMSGFIAESFGERRRRKRQQGLLLFPQTARLAFAPVRQGRRSPNSLSPPAC